jgi:hypothetical protein
MWDESEGGKELIAKGSGSQGWKNAGEISNERPRPRERCIDVAVEQLNRPGHSKCMKVRSEGE